MSGDIRRSIGLVRGRLQSSINFALKTIKRNDSSQIDEAIEKVTKQKDSLNNLLLEWRQYIDNLPESEKADEVSRQEEYTVRYHDPTEDLKLANDVLDDLKDVNSSHQPRSRDSLTSEETGKEIKEEPSHPLRPNLPRLPIQKYDGKITDWLNWYAMFRAAVHDRDLDDNSKLLYLKGYLTGEAEQEVLGLCSLGASYSAVMERLRKRFGRSDLLRTQLHTELATTPPADDTPKSLRQTYRTISSIISQLRSIGDDVDHVVISSQIESKFVPLLFILLEIKRSSFVWSTKRILEEIDEIIQEKEHVQRVQATYNAAKPPKPYRSEMKPTQPRYQQHTVEKRHCVYCGGDHPTYKCNKYSTIHERRDFLRQQNLCFNCTGPHNKTECKSKRGCYYCQSNHHSSLCDSQRPNTTTRKEYTSSFAKPDPNPWPKPAQPTQRRPPIKMSGGNATPLKPEVTLLVGNSEEEAHQPQYATPLMCRKITLTNPHDPSFSATFLAVVDTGSTSSYITPKVQQALNLPSLDPQQITLYGIAGQVNHASSTFTELFMSLKDGSHLMMTARVIQDIMPDITYANVPNDTIPYNITENLVYTHAKPEVLLGVDVSLDILEGCRSHMNNGYRVISTKIGAIISSPALLREPDEEIVMMSIETTNKNEPTSIEDLCETKEDEEAVHHFLNTIQIKDNRYVVSLPRRQCQLPTSMAGIAIGRLRSVLRRLSPEQLQQYDNYFKTWEDTGIIKEASHYTPNHRIFLSHHPIWKKDKLRVVIDGSCRDPITKSSLNTCLLRGPVILPKTCGLIAKFRTAPIPLLADIEGAFLQLSLHPEDSDLCCFFWLHNIQWPPTTQNLKTFTFLRLPFGLVSAPFLLAATILYHLEQYTSPLAREIRAKIYVDNVFMEARSYEEAQHKFFESRSLFQQASMNLREFISCDRKVNEFLASQGMDIPNETKVLGIRWIINTDCLDLQPQIPQLLHETLTRRVLASQLGSIYDPMGAMTPLTLQAKLLVQKYANKEWDTAISSEAEQEWHQLLESWTGDPITIPRRIPNDGDGALSLHGFADASPVAKCTILFIRAETDNGISTHFLTARCKITPKNQPANNTTIPKLEFDSLILTAETVQVFSQALHIPEIHIWSDSMITIAWATAEKMAKEALIHRRQEKYRKIAQGINPKFIKSSQNPADIGTRPKTLDELRSADIWWHGPPWLSSRKIEWPDQPPIRLEKTEPHISPKEIQPIQPNSSEKPRETTLLTINDPTTLSTLDITRFSSYIRALNTMTTVIRASMLLQRQQPPEINRLLVKARHQLVLEAQRRFPPSPSDRKQLHLFQDPDGIWRVQSRLPNHALNGAQPIYINRQDPLTKLLLTHIHATSMHAGLAATLASIRRQFWIPKAKQLLNKIIRSCVICQKHRAAPYKLPAFPPYPNSRLHRVEPFKHCSVDLFGPVTVKTESGKAKRWVTLFSCQTTRSLHLELTHDLSGEALSHAFRRFFARRGTPKAFLSDQGTNLRLLRTCLREFWPENTVNWKLIPPGAPWQNGLAERMVGIVKTSLRKILGRRLIHETEFISLLAEAEAISNNRPITTVPDIDDPTRTLRPIDFLRPGGLPTKDLTEPMSFDNETDDATYTLNDSDPTSELRKSFASTNELLTKFWTEWVNLYTSTLMERWQRQHRGGRNSRNHLPQKRDIVIVLDHDSPRNSWQLGIIEEVPQELPIRSAKVRMPNGRLLERPLNHLAPLELAPQAVNEEESSRESPQPPTQNDEIPNPRPIREAARKAKLIFPTLLTLCFLALFPLSTSADPLCSCSVVKPSCCSFIQKTGLLTLIAGTIALIPAILLLWRLIKLLGTILSLPFRRRSRNRRSLLPSHRRNSPSDQRTRNQRRTHSRSVSYLLTVVTIGSLHLSQACNEVAAISSNQTSCITKYDSAGLPISRICRYSTILRLMMRPTDQHACISMAPPLDADNITNLRPHTLRLSSVGTFHSCNPVTTTFSRDHQLVTKSSHRCRGMGSCEETHCEDVRSNTSLIELSDEDNRNPGHSYCARSCQCISCGCFSCSPSCLYFRTIARTTSDTKIYKIFHCPTWSTTVRINITSDVGTSSEVTTSHSLQLNTPQQINEPALKMTALQAPAPVSATTHWTFIQPTDHNVTYFLPRTISAGGPGTPAQLVCPTLEMANRFDCGFMENACICHPAYHSANCRCSQFSFASLHGANELPIQQGKESVRADNGIITLQADQAGSVNIQIELADTPITFEIDQHRCILEVKEITGCYSCAAAATVRILCKSPRSFSGSISCDEGTLPIFCGPQGEENYMSISSERAQLERRCLSSCSDPITVSATLADPPSEDLMDLAQDEFRIDMPFTFELPELPNVATFLFSSMLPFLVLLVLLVLYCHPARILARLIHH